jgi:copper transport protein
VPSDLAHTAAAAAWLGGLAALLVLVPHLGGEARQDATRRVSSTAFVAVPVLAAAGLLRALTELGALDHLWTTSYGRALIAKTALFVPVVALGWLNRTRLLAAAQALRRSVRVEVVVLALVVGVVAVLVQLRPGRDVTRAAAAPAAPVGTQPPALPPADAVVEALEDGSLAVAVGRGATGTTVTLLGPDGTGVDGRAVLVDGIPTLPCGPGCYRTRDRQGPLRVSVDGRVLTFDVPRRAPGAAGLLRRATAAYRGARTIVFDESLRSGPRNGIVTRFMLVAPDRLAYRIRGGAQAVVLGTRRWDRSTPRGRWVESEQTPLQVTRPYWRQATNVHLVAPRTLTFVDPSLPGWFRLTVDARGRPKALRMVAAAHFMSDRYVAYDAPVELSPPSR